MLRRLENWSRHLDATRDGGRLIGRRFDRTPDTFYPVWMASRPHPFRIGPFAIFLLALSLACGESELTGTRRVLPVELQGDLVDVVAPATNHLLILASLPGESRIYLSRDGGANLVVAQRPASGVLRSLAMANAEIGWAVGPGEILRTEDGGAHWRRQRGPRRGAELDLFQVAAIDETRAVALARGGLRLRTSDGGAVWQEIPAQPLDSEEGFVEWTALACARDGSGHCWAAGNEIYFSADGGGEWKPLALLDPLEIPPFVFGFGQFEISEAEAVGLRDRLAARPTGAGPMWEIDVRVSRGEIERIAEDGDPQALFELIESRGEELRLRLEGFGIGADRIFRVGLPPWGYEDFIDDDVELLTRYWSGREGSEPSAQIRVREPLALNALAFETSAFGAGVGRSGRGVESRDPAATWMPTGKVLSADLLDLALAGGRIWAVGAAGHLWVRSAGSGQWERVELPESSGRPSALRGIAFDPMGQGGYIVGDGARLLRTTDGGKGWRSGPTQVPVVTEGR